MKFLYRKYPAKRSEVVEVLPSHSTAAKFMTAAEFKRYAGGRTHTYFRGQGQDKISFTVPFDGIWHVVLEKAKDGVAVDLSAQCRLCMPAPTTERTIRIGSEEEHTQDEEEIQAVSLGSQSEG